MRHARGADLQASASTARAGCCAGLCLHSLVLPSAAAHLDSVPWYRRYRRRHLCAVGELGHRAMTTPGDAALRTLRMKYKTASTAHASCVEALLDARWRGEQPSQELLEQEAKASRALDEARANLLAAMAPVSGS